MFSLHESTNYQKVVKVGEHIGNSKDPNIHQVFQKVTEEIAEETNLNLRYAPSYVFPKESIVPVIVSIKKIEWLFNNSKATMHTHLEYKLPEKTMNIIGTHQFKVFIAGTKTGNLNKSLKDGLRQFLTAI